MSGLRRRYSEITANRPGQYDSVRDVAIPLQANRDRYNPVVYDRALTPDGQEEPTRKRSYINPNKNVNSHPLRESKVDQKLMNQKQSVVKKSSFYATNLGLFKPDEKKREALYKTAQSRPKPAAINSENQTEIPTLSGRIDARRKTVPDVSEKPTRPSRTAPDIKRKLSTEPKSPLVPAQRAKTPIRHAPIERVVVQHVPMDPFSQSQEIQRGEHIIRHKETTTSPASCHVPLPSYNRIPTFWTDEDEKLISEAQLTDKMMNSAVRRNKTKLLASLEKRDDFEPTLRLRSPVLRFDIERYKTFIQQKKTPELVIIDSD